jgi:putative Holliday junction resolvase
VSATANREGSERVLGADLGERRIGIAVGEPRTGVVTPLRTLSRARDPREDARVLARLAAELRAGELVVGLPLNADGSEGPQALGTREWAAVVAVESGLRLRFRDERLTSQRAERRIGGPARGRSGGPPSAARRDAHRARIDREAAALILQDEFDARAGAGTGVGKGGAATTPRQTPGEQDR